MPAPTHPRLPRGLLLVVAAAALVLLAATGATAACTDYGSCCGTACQLANFQFAKAIGEAMLLGMTGTWTVDNFCTAAAFFTCDAEGLHVSIDGKYVFMSSLPELAFSGVASSSDLMVPSITLKGCTIPGTLPWSWGSVISLTDISITNTGSMASTLPSEWAGLTNLRTLLLTGTNVSGTIPTSWGAMTSLRSVSLASTSVTGCLPTTWVCGANLTLESVGLPASSECPAKEALCTTSPSCAAEHSSKAPRWAIGVVVTLGGLLLILVAADVAVLITRPECLFGRRYDDWSGSNSERSFEGSVHSSEEGSRTATRENSRLRSRNDSVNSRDGRYYGNNNSRTVGTTEGGEGKRKTKDSAETTAGGDGKKSQGKSFSKESHREAKGRREGGANQSSSRSISPSESIDPLWMPIQDSASGSSSSGSRSTSSTSSGTTSSNNITAASSGVPRMVRDVNDITFTLANRGTRS